MVQRLATPIHTLLFFSYHMMLSIQGGGIYIDGSADLADCNIHDNVATDVSPLLKLNP